MKSIILKSILAIIITVFTLSFLFFLNMYITEKRNEGFLNGVLGFAGGGYMDKYPRKAEIAKKVIGQLVPGNIGFKHEDVPYPEQFDAQYLIFNHEDGKSISLQRNLQRKGSMSINLILDEHPDIGKQKQVTVDFLLNTKTWKMIYLKEGSSDEPRVYVLGRTNDSGNTWTRVYVFYKSSFLTFEYTAPLTTELKQQLIDYANHLYLELSTIYEKDISPILVSEGFVGNI